jgi:hypothetical protein
LPKPKYHKIKFIIITNRFHGILEFSLQKAALNFVIKYITFLYIFSRNRSFVQPPKVQTIFPPSLSAEA